jgi:hypothetical protein
MRRRRGDRSFQKIKAFAAKSFTVWDLKLKRGDGRNDQRLRCQPGTGSFLDHAALDLSEGRIETLWAQEQLPSKPGSCYFSRRFRVVTWLRGRAQCYSHIIAGKPRLHHS